MYPSDDLGRHAPHTVETTPPLIAVASYLAELIMPQLSLAYPGVEYPLSGS